MPNYQDIILSKTTRQQDNCNFYICQTGRYKGHNKNPRNVPIIISVENGLYGSLPNSSTTTPTKVIGESNKRRSITICENCKQEVGKGLSHPKNCTIAKASTNLAKHALNLPSKQQDQVVSKLLNEKATNELGKGGFHKNITMKLSTKGRPATVTLNPRPKKPVYFSISRNFGIWQLLTKYHIFCQLI